MNFSSLLLYPSEIFDQFPLPANLNLNKNLHENNLYKTNFIENIDKFMSTTLK